MASGSREEWEGPHGRGGGGLGSGASATQRHPPKKLQLPLLQLPDGCGGNRNDMRALICLINLLCSRVVAIRPAVWAAFGAGQGSSWLLAPCLPNHCQALCLWGEGPQKGVSLAAGFCGFCSLIHSQSFNRCLLSTYYVPRRLPTVFRCAWKSGGQVAGDEGINIRGAFSYRKGLSLESHWRNWSKEVM